MTLPGSPTYSTLNKGADPQLTKCRNSVILYLGEVIMKYPYHTTNSILLPFVAPFIVDWFVPLTHLIFKRK